MFYSQGCWLLDIPPIQFFSRDLDKEEEELRSSDTEELGSPIAPTTIRTTKHHTSRLLTKAEKIGIKESYMNFIASLEKACADILRKTELWMINESDLA